MGKHRRSKRLAVKRRSKQKLSVIDDDFQEPMVEAIARFRKLQVKGIPHRNLRKKLEEAQPPSTEEEEADHTNIKDVQASSSFNEIIMLYEEESSHINDENDSTSESEIHAPMTPSFNYLDYSGTEDEEKDELDDGASDEESTALIKQKIYHKKPYCPNIRQNEYSFK